MRKQKYELIIAITKGSFADKVVEAARKSGASGATIIKARGTGIHEVDSFLGIAILPDKDVVLVLVEKQMRKKIMEAICVNAGLNTEANGLCFCMEVEDWSGMCHIENATVLPRGVQGEPTPVSDKPAEEQN